MGVYSMDSLKPKFIDIHVSLGGSAFFKLQCCQDVKYQQI